VAWVRERANILPVLADGFFLCQSIPFLHCIHGATRASGHVKGRHTYYTPFFYFVQNWMMGIDTPFLLSSWFGTRTLVWFWVVNSASFRKNLRL
jgi:hypothetical protein